MSRAPRFPWVQVVRLRSGAVRYRAARSIDGVKRFGALRATREQAHADAVGFAREREEAPTVEISFGEAIDMTHDELQTKRSQGTVEWFDEQIAALEACWSRGIRLSTISSEGIETFIRRRLRMAAREDEDGNPIRLVSVNTVRHNLRALSRILNLALRRGHLRTNPLKRVDLPREQQRAMDFFAPLEVATILRKIRETDLPASVPHAELIEILFLTGMRRGELARLTTGDVDLVRELIFVRGKTGARELIVTPELAKVLRRVLMRTPDGGRLVPGGEEYLANMMRVWRLRLGEKRLHAHAMRHSAATAMVAAGVDVHTIAIVLGHRSLRMVMRYLHARGDAVRAAMSALTTQRTRAGSHARGKQA